MLQNYSFQQNMGRSILASRTHMEKLTNGSEKKQMSVTSKDQLKEKMKLGGTHHTPKIW